MLPKRASAIKDLVSNSPLSKKIQSHLKDHFGRANTPASDEESRPPLELVCSACREGPFSYKGFRQATLKAHYDDTTGYCYTRAWTEIAQSARNEGCSWCRIVIRARDGLPYDKFPYGKETGEVRLQIGTDFRKELSVYIDGFKAVTYTIYASPGDPAVKAIGKEVITFPKELYIDYQKVFEVVSQCSEHEHCPSAIQETYLPTRVIDCSDPSKPRLVQTNRQIRGRYCTLSYVWGGDQTQKTTTLNIGTYINEGINIPLPQTIADAIFVTNKLGLQYLWVDAICIIQDSDEDKIKELGIMSSIYRDSYLTISVLSAFRADHGFLPDARGPDVLPFHLANKSIGRMLLEFNLPRQTLGSGKYETIVMHRPLEERGWCFQESTLSARRLIFQPPNVSYKCRSFCERDITRPYPPVQLSQRGEEEAPYPANDYILFTTNKDHGTTHAADEPEDEGLPERWRRILLDYSETKITVASDKFVAFSSIAEVFQSNFQDQYIAGLWKQTLFRDLFWEVRPPMGPDQAHLPRPVPYRAPTWSWASVDGQLDLQYGTVEPASSAACYEAEIVTCEATPKIRSLPFGEVADAKLTMRVKMHPLMRDGRKCKLIERKGTRWGSQFASNLSETHWIPPPGNCLEPSSLVVIGESDADDGVDGEAENDEDDGDEPEDGNEQEQEEGREEDKDGKADEDGQDQEAKGVTRIRFDCLEGTEQDREQGFYVIILSAGKKWKNQGDWMQGFLVLRVDGEVEQYRRVGVLNPGCDFQWPDWFDAMPLRNVTLI